MRNPPALKLSTTLVSCLICSSDTLEQGIPSMSAIPFLYSSVKLARSMKSADSWSCLETKSRSWLLIFRWAARIVSLLKQSSSTSCAEGESLSSVSSRKVFEKVRQIKVLRMKTLDMVLHGIAATNMLMS